MAAYWEPEGYHQLGEGEYADRAAADVLARMKEAAGVATMANLALWLGVRPSHVFDAKRRNIIPIQWLRQLILKKRDYNPLWVLTGQGEKLW